MHWVWTIVVMISNSMFFCLLSGTCLYSIADIYIIIWYHHHSSTQPFSGRGQETESNCMEDLESSYQVQVSGPMTHLLYDHCSAVPWWMTSLISGRDVFLSKIAFFIKLVKYFCNCSIPHAHYPHHYILFLNQWLP